MQRPIKRTYMVGYLQATVLNRPALRTAVAIDKPETRCVCIVKAVHKVRT